MATNYLTAEEALAINNLMPGNQNAQLGSKLKTALDYLGIVGTSYYLDPANGADTNDGLSPQTAMATLPAAYAKLTANKNDVLYYIANNGSISLSEQFTWAKNYTHFIGICAPVWAAKRARIFQTASATGLSPLINFTATGCICKNIYTFQGVADATSLVNWQITGGRNYFENCHFAGIGDVTQSAAGSASLKLDGAEENVFKNCQIGLDTIARDADATELWFDGAANRNVFDSCLIYGYASAAGYSQVTLEDATAIDRYTIFKDCLFETDSENQTIAQTSVFNIKEAIVQGKIILINSFALTDGTAEWDSNNRGIIFNNSVAAAAGAAGGIMTKQ